MVTQAVEPIKSTILEGTIAARVVLLVGVAAVAYGLMQLNTALVRFQAIEPGASDPGVMGPTLTAFLGVVGGLCVVVLAVALDFSWSDA